MYGINDTSFKKYRIWRGLGTKVSANSRLGMEIAANNKNTRTISKHEVERIVSNNKMCNAMYFWPITNILEVMARNGKINGIYLNMKQGWQFQDVTYDEIKTKNKMSWKVRYDNYDDFVVDINQIRDYRMYHINANTSNEETENVVNDMLRDEWTMNVIDGNVTRKQLWHKYRMDTIKIMNLEFRLKDDITNRGVTEIPIVFCEDNGDYNSQKYDENKLRLLENKWSVTTGASSIPTKKKKKQQVQKTKSKTKQIRMGNEELIKSTLEIKKMLVSLKENPISNEEMLTFDKFDQIKAVNETKFDEETKEMMMQIIVSRQEDGELKYKTLEDVLLTGKNYMIQMPKIETLRTNILGMVQEIENSAPENWNDRNLQQRLQKMTGIRMKKLINHNLKEIVRVLVTFRKEMELINELKSQCETKENFNLVQFKDLLKQIIGEKEYENEKIEFMDRWCEEIENNLERGMNKGSTSNRNEDEENKQMCSTVKKANKRRFVISSDSEDSFIIPKKAKWPKMTKKTNVTKRQIEYGPVRKEETIIISSDSCQDVSNSDTNSDVIPRDNITYLMYSSEEE